MAKQKLMIAVTVATVVALVPLDAVRRHPIRSIRKRQRANPRRLPRTSTPCRDIANQLKAKSCST